MLVFVARNTNWSCLRSRRRLSLGLSLGLFSMALFAARGGGHST